MYVYWNQLTIFKNYAEFKQSCRQNILDGMTSGKCDLAAEYFSEWWQSLSFRLFLIEISPGKKALYGG